MPALRGGELGGDAPRELLQTVDYIRAVLEAIDPKAVRPVDVERRTAWRITRQHIMRRPDPPAFHLILDESVLRGLSVTAW